MFNSRRPFLRWLVGCLFLALIAAPPAPAQSPAQKQAETELLSLHQEERRAHFDHNVNFLLAHVAPQLLDVREGRVNRMSRDDVRERFQQYFKHAQFSAWDDLEPPVVHASPDGRLGWMIVRVRIAYTENDTSGKKTQQNTVGAWMSVYEKQNGAWFMTAVTSTFAEQ